MNKEVKMKHVLHLTPHIGGGVGRVILNYLEQEKENLNYTHELACLDSISERELAVIQQHEFCSADNLYQDLPLLFEKIKLADIVLLHWWNHPLLFDLLVRFELPACRLIMWSHVSGLHGTNIFTQKLLNYPDEFIFTTPISFDSDIVRNSPFKANKKLQYIWSTSGVKYIKKVGVRKDKSNFCIGYIGTVDYAKIHADFVELANSINIKNKKMIICGGGNETKISQDADNSGFGEKFYFTGEVSEINDYLSKFDVFGYPLSASHYGTCDQVLAEAMAAGIVPVVFNGPMETSMVVHKKTGLVVESKKQYAEAIELLHRDLPLRVLLSKNASQFADEFFSLKKMRDAWEATFDRVILQDKTIKYWLQGNNYPTSAVEVFFESLGNAASPFIGYLNAETASVAEVYKKEILCLADEPQWQSKSKGTVHQYLHFFPDDEQLMQFSTMMNNGSENS